MKLTVFTLKNLKIINSYPELLTSLRNTYKRLHFPQQMSKHVYVETEFGFIAFLNVKPYFANRIAISTLGDEATFMPKHASWSDARPQHPGPKPP